MRGAWQWGGSCFAATPEGLRAEHGFSALVIVRRASTTTALLFDTGISPDGMTANANRLGVDLTQIQGSCSATGTSITPGDWRACPQCEAVARCR